MPASPPATIALPALLRPTWAGLALFAAALSGHAGCSSRGEQPCSDCLPDSGFDASIATVDAPPPEGYDGPSDDIAPVDGLVPIDGWLTEDGGRDGPSSSDAVAADRPGDRFPDAEPYRPRDLDAGSLLFRADFENEEASAPPTDFQPVRPPTGASSPWAVLVDESRHHVLSQGRLEPGTWHIAAARSVDPRADQIIRATLRVTSFAAADALSAVALFGRYDEDADSGYYLAVRGDGSISLRKRQAGANVTLGDSVECSVQPADWYEAQLEIVGDELRGFVGSTCAVRAWDPGGLSSGTIAVGSVGAAFEIDAITLSRPDR